MKTKWSYFLLTFLGFIILSNTSLTQQNESSRLKNLCENKFDWLISKQTDSLNNLLDDRLLYIHSNGLIETKEDVIDHLLTGKLIYLQVDLDDLTVRISGSTGLVTGTGLFHGKMDGKEFAAKLLFTEVYIKENQQWQLISRHANKLP